ncbi:MAG: ABC transporter permease [Aquabacterium sp.]|uniref:ABC transporter permease n=1 Tax=Aquabacterium sp. TaxID=1872578 RepID=UPI003BE01000
MSSSADDIDVFPATAVTTSDVTPVASTLVDAARQGLNLVSTVALGLIFPILLWGLWWLAADRHWIAEQILPSPAFVWESLQLVLDSGELQGHVKYSLARAGWSLLIGGGVGAVLGFGMALSQSFKAYVQPTFNALAQLPVLGWIPLLIIFVGIDEALKITAVSISVVVPVALSTYNGIANIPKSLLEVGRVYQFSPLQVIFRIVLPAAAPAFFTGLRQGVMQAWLSVIFVELLSSSEGLGFFMAYSRQLSQIDMVIVAMLAIGVMGIVIELALRLIESRLQRWRRTAF